MEYYNTIDSGKRIKMLRKMYGLTQCELADRIGISLSSIQKIETGRRGISIDLLIEFSYYLNCSFEYIILGHDHESSCPSNKGDVKNAVSSLSQELLALASIL